MSTSPAAREQLAHEVVIGPVIGDELAQEIVEDAASRCGDAFVRACDLVAVGEEESELVGVGGRAEQLVDEPLALVRRSVLEKTLGLLGGRDAAGEIEIDAAKELGVGGAGRGLDAVGRHPFRHELVDEVTRIG